MTYQVRAQKCYACCREIPVSPAELEVARLEAEGLAYLRKRLSDEGIRPEDYTAGIAGWASKDEGKTCQLFGWRAEVKKANVTFSMHAESPGALAGAIIFLFSPVVLR